MKKMLLGLALGLLTFVGVSSLTPAFAQTDGSFQAGSFGDTSAAGGLGVSGAWEEASGGLIDMIKTFINWILGMLGLVALVLCLYAGFKITTAGGDEKKVTDGKTILKNAGIGLAIIALSWMIVSLIFWIIGGVTGS